MKKVLIIAYYFPPLGMGGTQRAAKFVKYLPQYGWQPIVLTVKDIAYYAFDESLLDDVRSAKVYRTGSLDPQRLLYLFRKNKNAANNRGEGVSAGQRFLGKFLSWIFIPDNKVLWLPFAFFKAKKIIQKDRIDAIITTSPPHSVHLLGILLKRLLRVKWIADLRDGWTAGNFQEEPTAFHCFLNRTMERMVLNKTDAVVAVSSGLRDNLEKVLIAPKNIQTITNGFDEDDFLALETTYKNDYFTISYIGTISNIAPVSDLIKGVATLLQKNRELKKVVRLKFIGQNLSGNTQTIVEELELKDIVEFKGYVNHKRAIAQLLQSELLIYPVSEKASKDFIPGKTFEYLACGKPVLVIGPEVEGVSILKKHTQTEVVNTGKYDEIAIALEKLIEQRKIKKGRPDLAALSEYERKTLTARLAEVLNSLK